MNVETYEEISIDEQHGAVVDEQVSEEALAIIGALGLTGQQALINKTPLTDDEDGETTERRLPYRQITAEEAHVFGVLCPKRTKLEQYRDGPIPLRVLQVAAHARDMFTDLYVLSPATPRDEDPVLIGTRKNPERSWQTDTFILARWGNVLLPMEEMRALALARLRPVVALAIESARREIESFAASLDAHLAIHLSGGDVRIPFVDVTLPAAR